MMNQKEKNEVRDNSYQTMEEVLELNGFELEGRSKEGLVYSNGEQAMVIKVVMKKENFDVEDALAEFAEAEQKRLEREAQKAEKAAKREKEKAEEE